MWLILLFFAGFLGFSIWILGLGSSRLCIGGWIVGCAWTCFNFSYTFNGSLWLTDGSATCSIPALCCENRNIWPFKILPCSQVIIVNAYLSIFNWYYHGVDYHGVFVALKIKMSVLLLKINYSSCLQSGSDRHTNWNHKTIWYQILCGANITFQFHNRKSSH